MNARAYTLLATMIRGDQLVAESARLKQLYASSNVPKAACKYWYKLQEICGPAEEMDEVMMKEELGKLSLNHTNNPEELALRIAAIVNNHQTTLPQKRKITIITSCGMIHHGNIIHQENKLRQLTEQPSRKALPEELIKAMHDCWILHGKGKYYNPPEAVGKTDASKTNLADVEGKMCNYCGKAHDEKTMLEENKR